MNITVAPIMKFLGDTTIPLGQQFGFTPEGANDPANYRDTGICKIIIEHEGRLAAALFHGTLKEWNESPSAREKILGPLVRLFNNKEKV